MIIYKFLLKFLLNLPEQEFFYFCMYEILDIKKEIKYNMPKQKKNQAEEKPGAILEVKSYETKKCKIGQKGIK